MGKKNYYGIDLKFFYKLLRSCLEGGEPVVIQMQGNRTTPSIVAFTKDGERLVGRWLNDQAVIRTIFSLLSETAWGPTMGNHPRR